MLPNKTNILYIGSINTTFSVREEDRIKISKSPSKCSFDGAVQDGKKGR